jgi:hypothetical protein
MKFAFIAPFVFVLAAAVPLAAAHADTIQVQVPGVVVVPGVAPAPDHRDRERCDALESQERDLRARLEHASYGDERERTEHQLRDIHGELDHCHH